jgi:hypothetical protein
MLPFVPFRAQEIINILSLASKWLLRDAIDVSGERRMPFPPFI